MDRTSPLKLCKTVEERYREYLLTSYRFKDPDLNRTFKEALAGSSLAKGPYLEVSPPFRKGRLPGEVFASLLGHPAEEAFVRALKGNRNLYLHQDRALEKVTRGRNVIVSTGTGSGKTEAFLLPILLHLYKEHEHGTLGPGVRAMILYPMNALANDQRDRLGEIAAALKKEGSRFSFTFGQYIGETPENLGDRYRAAEEKMRERKPGELVFREEMRNAPPNILLTNFSMLEYLLLRPYDSPLFQGESARNWTFIVLDEVHQYRGSIGIEMSMLIRRLKRRIQEGGRTGPFRCVGTSATLSDGKKGFPAVAEFASTIFAEPFEAEDVISGDVEDITGEESIMLPAETLRELASNLDEPQALNHQLDSIFSGADFLGFPDGESKELVMGNLLAHESHATRLRNAVNGNPMPVETLAELIFPEAPEALRHDALTALIECLSWARNPENGEPFGSPRYHFFLRALEGAFVSYVPEKRVFVERLSGSGDGAVFETAVCKECGQHYFVGRLEKQGNLFRLVEAIRDPGDIDFGVDYFRPLEKNEPEAGDEEEAPTDNGNGLEEEEGESFLCPVCGAYGEWAPPACGHDFSMMLRVKRETSSDDESKVKERLYVCRACGAKSPNAPIRDVISGSDAPHAVVSTALHANLPPERRKILAFADGRQEAAYFAWYLENSYKSFLRGHLVSEALESLRLRNPDGVSAEDLVYSLVDLAGREGLFTLTATQQEMFRECWTWVLEEFFTTSRRISPEGVGLVHWKIGLHKTFEIPPEMLAPPFNFSREEALELIEFLLDTSRRQGTVEFTGATGNAVSWQNIGFGIGQKYLVYGKPNGTKITVSWCGSGMRRKVLKNVLEARGIEPEHSEALAGEFLALAWGAVADWDNKMATRDSERIFVPIEGGARVNIRWFRAIGERFGTVYRCELCGQVQYRPLFGICERPGCVGTVIPIDSLSLGENHYRRLYEEPLPGKMRVEEHTAQLSHDKAREYQKDFKRGLIHVLSCSTTFELGVDLGDLDNVFLRNVPPESFNYAQRVGRAGRRRGFPGLAITFCRRSPHDLYHFADPLGIIRGSIRVPAVRIVNDKILLRHVAGVILSDFFRYHGGRFGKLEEMFGPDPTRPTVLNEVRLHVRKHVGRLGESLKAILPMETSGKLGVGTTNAWVEVICGEKSRMAEAQHSFASDIADIQAFKDEAKARDELKAANWAKSMERTLLGDDCLSFLSRQAVIPKYGFPVDVVELDTRWSKTFEGQQIQLQRDLSLAIGEFAPTSSVIANKKEWKSHSLKRVAGKEWERRHYKRCKVHNCYVQWKEGQPEPALECGDRAERRTYIIPSFGFVVSHEEQAKEPRFKPTRLFSMRPYFAGPLPDNPKRPDVLLFDENAPILRLRPAQPGLMSVICEGRRESEFLICEKCGFGAIVPPKKKKEEKIPSHETYMGKKCTGSLARYSLGHEFITDVLEVHFVPEAEEGVDLLSLAFSLAYALSEGAAEAIGIPSTDLSTTVGEVLPESRKIPPIILYDAVPGGAGIVSSLEKPEVFRETLERAFLRVDGRCGCDPAISCYGCLRSYRNQFAHRFLQRGLAKSYLAGLLRED